MNNESKRKKFIGDLIRQLDTTKKEDWQRRNIALIKLKASITDPEQPLRFTSHEIALLRVALFQQLEDLRSTIVKEACNIVAKMAELMPKEFESSAPMFLKVLLSRLHVSVKVIADAMDGCIRALITHLPCKVLLPQIVQGTRDLKNTVLRQRCLEYVLLMLQIVPKDKLETHRDSFEEILSRALDDASKDIRSVARDSLYLFATHWPDRARQLVSTLDSTVRKVLSNDPGFEHLLIDESNCSLALKTTCDSLASTASTSTLTSSANSISTVTSTSSSTRDTPHENSPVVAALGDYVEEQRGRSLSSASHERAHFPSSQDDCSLSRFARVLSPSPSQSRDSSLSPPDSPRSTRSVIVSKTKSSTAKRGRRRSVGPLSPTSTNVSAALSSLHLVDTSSLSSVSSPPHESLPAKPSRRGLPKPLAKNPLKATPSLATKATPKAASLRARTGSSGSSGKLGNSTSVFAATKPKTTTPNSDDGRTRATKTDNNASNVKTKERSLKTTTSATARSVARVSDSVGAAQNSTTASSSSDNLSKSSAQSSLSSHVQAASSPLSLSASTTSPLPSGATTTLTSLPILSSLTPIAASNSATTPTPWSLVRPRPLEESTEVLLLKLRRLLERSRRSVLRDRTYFSQNTPNE